MKKRNQIVLTLTLLAIFAGVILAGNPQQPPYQINSTIASGIVVGLWHCDENTGTVAYDTTDNDNNGSLKYDATWQELGCFNSCLYFDGDSGYVNVPHDNSLSTYWLTVQFWINPFAFLYDTTTIIEKENCWAIMADSDGQVLVRADTSSVSVVWATGYEFKAGRWSNFGLSYDGVMMLLWINNEVVADTVVSMDSLDTSALPLVIGNEVGEADSLTEGFFGLIDDIRVGKYALDCGYSGSAGLYDYQYFFNLPQYQFDGAISIYEVAGKPAWLNDMEVDWDDIVDIPAGFLDGVDNSGEATDSLTLDSLGTSVNVVADSLFDFRAWIFGDSIFVATRAGSSYWSDTSAYSVTTLNSDSATFADTAEYARASPSGAGADWTDTLRFGATKVDGDSLFKVITNFYDFTNDPWGAKRAESTHVALEMTSISGAQDVAAMTEVAGDILYHTGGSWNRRAIGSANDVLYISSGTPQWGHVTSAMITDSTITGADVGYGVLKSGHILDGTITSADIGTDQVYSVDIKNETIVSADISNGTIVGADIYDGTVDSTEISNVGVSDVSANLEAHWWNAWGDAALTSAHIVVGNGSNIATAVNPGGDVEFSNAGVTTIQDGAVDATDIIDGSCLTEILDDDGSGSLLDADFLDGQSGSYYRNATNLNAGTVSISLYDAHTELADAGYLGNASGDIAQNNGVLQPDLNADLFGGQDPSYYLDGLSGNEVKTYVGQMVTGNTQTGIGVTYQSGDYTLDFVVSGITSAMITNGAILNADINASAAIAQSKIAGLDDSFLNDDTDETMSGVLTLTDSLKVEGLMISNGIEPDTDGGATSGTLAKAWGWIYSDGMTINNSGTVKDNLYVWDDLDVGDSLSVGGNATIAGVLACGPLTVTGADGIDFTTGSDEDIDLLTIDVTGAPRIWWDESENGFVVSDKTQFDQEIFVYGNGSYGVRIYGVEIAKEMADFYVDANGALYIDTRDGTDDGAYICIASEDDNFGTVIFESDGSNVLAYLNIYVTDTDSDYVNFVMKNQQSIKGLTINEHEMVGIRTAHPTEALDVNGNATVAGNTFVDGNIYIDADSAGTSVPKIYANGTNSYLVFSTIAHEWYVDGLAGIGEMWHGANDGAGSGLDADLLDGSSSAAFATAGHSHANYADTGHVHLEVVDDYISAAEAYNFTATLTTALNHPVLSFDPDTDNLCYWGYRIHDNFYGSTCTLTVVWNTSENLAGSEYVVWKGQAYWGGAGESYAAQNQAWTNSSTISAANLIKEDDVILTSISAGDNIGWLYYRDADNGSDTADDPSRILGFRIKYTIQGKPRTSGLGL